jgi:uncharacterized protein with HEPN domain
MPSRDWNFRIEDILEAIDDIGRLIGNLAYEGFCVNTATLKAVLYNTAVIGEAGRQDRYSS